MSEPYDLYKQLEEEEAEQQEDERASLDFHDLRIYPADILLQDYLSHWEKGQFEMPEFQRNYIWKINQASRFIESFLLGLPVPAIFVYKENKTSLKQIIDGQQRLTTIVSFLKGQFESGEFEGKEFRLKGVSKEWNGKLFTDLNEEEKGRINDATMRSTIIEKNHETDDLRIYDIFERFNTGGKILNNMEVRLCVAESDFTGMLREVNKLPQWRKILGKEKTDPRFGDMELILRFFALEEVGKKYRKPMKNFLDEYAKSIKKKDMQWVETKKKLFIEAIDKAASIKPDLFVIEDRDTGKKRFSTPAFESIMVALSQAGPKVNLMKAYKELLGNDEYYESIMQGKWTTDAEPVTKRIEIANRIFKNA